MKKTMVLLLLSMLSLPSYCQLVTVDKLKAMKIQQYGQQNWKNTAKSIASSLKMGTGDKYAKLVGDRVDNQYYDGSIHYISIVEDLSMDKSQLFQKFKLWATNNFNRSDSNIKLLDENAGSIIIQEAVKNIIDNVGGMYNFTISIYPIIKIDLKDGRCRITFTLSSYKILRESKSGGLFTSNSHNEEDWNISSCFPFTSSYDDHEKSSAKALVMSHLCAKEYLRIIEEIARNNTNLNSLEDNW